MTIFFNIKLNAQLYSQIIVCVINNMHIRIIKLKKYITSISPDIKDDVPVRATQNFGVNVFKNTEAERNKNQNNNNAKLKYMYIFLFLTNNILHS